MFKEYKLGARQVGNDKEKGSVEFNIFFPKGFDPEIKSIRVAGDFQSKISRYPNWDFDIGFGLTKKDTLDGKGTLLTYVTDKELATGFYEYKYQVVFKDGSKRIVSDPCARYGGKVNQNAAFVIGGSKPSDNEVKPLKNGRKLLRDLAIYEMMIDDFTSGYRGNRAPLSAVIDKLDYIKDLGFNAILFMPWTSWKNPDFNWGYEPFQYFAVEYRYANEEGKPAEKLSWLKKMISECHGRDIQVIMDGVYNHVSMDFPYKQMYLKEENCPFTGEYGGMFPGLQDLNFNNDCTNEFINDVCFYWIDTFGIDGIRFDNTVNFYKPGDHMGLDRLIPAIKEKLDLLKQKCFSFSLEHIAIDAPEVTKAVGATSYWDNALYERAFDYLYSNRIDSRFLNALTNYRYLDPNERVPTIYITDHDHSQAAWQAGARENLGRIRWYKTQPYVIALYTSPATPLVYNGNEFAEDYFLPEDDHGTGTRVSPRPLGWVKSKDAIGTGISALYKRMGEIRQQYPGLRAAYFEPAPWEEWQTQFNPRGYGIDVSRQLVIYHRWGDDGHGNEQQFVIVLNFSDYTQNVSVPFPESGVWTDLLSGYSGTWKPAVNNRWLNFDIGSNWGHVFYKEKT